MRGAAGESVLVRAIDRVGEIVLFPHRDVLRAIGAFIEPQNPERIGRRILRVRIPVEPLQVRGDFLREIRSHGRRVGIVGRGVGEIAQRPRIAAHLVVGENALAAAHAVGRIRAQHAVVRPERHLLGVIAIAGDQIRHVGDRRLMRIVGNQRRLPRPGSRRPVFHHRHRRAFDEVEPVALRAHVVPERRTLVE